MMGLMEGVEPAMVMKSGGASELKYSRNRLSNTESGTDVLDCVGVCHDPRLFISKLKALGLLVPVFPLLNDDPAPTMEPDSLGATYSKAGVVNIGLLAMIVKGRLGFTSVLPKPKSIRIALSVAVDCEILSSRRLSTLGSKVVSELQLRGLVAFGEEGRAVEVEDMERALSDGLAAFFGTEKVKADCLRDTFSLCRRLSISRRFSFSCCAASF